jgi:hypothetical protein
MKASTMLAAPSPSDKILIIFVVAGLKVLYLLFQQVLYGRSQKAKQERNEHHDPQRCWRYIKAKEAYIDKVRVVFCKKDQNCNYRNKYDEI